MGILGIFEVCALDTAKNPRSSWEIYGHFTKFLGNSWTLFDRCRIFLGICGSFRDIAKFLCGQATAQQAREKKRERESKQKEPGGKQCV